MTWRDRLRAALGCSCEAMRALLDAAQRDLAGAEAKLAVVTRERDEAQERHNASATRLEILARIERAAGRPGDEAHGVVLAWQADHQQLETVQEALAEYMAENNLLRRQLHSVALQSMSTVDMMKTPITDRDPPKRGGN